MSNLITHIRNEMEASKIEHRKNTSTWGKDFRKNWSLYLFILPVIAYYLIFCYYPMYGATIAFKEFNIARGIGGSEWIGIKHLISFFRYPDVGRLFRNTLVMSISGLIVSRVTELCFALMLHELRFKKFKRVTQTISIFPHFISSVVCCTIFTNFCLTDGLFNNIMSWFGWTPVNLLTLPNAFVPIMRIMGIWTGVGWGSIINLAAMSGIDPQIYEAAELDGCSRIKRMFYITMPAIRPTRVITLIMAIGGLLSVGHESIILMYNPSIYSTADVISTYVYRQGLVKFNYSYSSAIGLMNSIFNIVLLLIANKIAKTVTETSLL